jgi:hypothetical protein
MCGTVGDRSVVAAACAKVSQHQQPGDSHAGDADQRWERKIGAP